MKLSIPKPDPDLVRIQSDHQLRGFSIREWGGTKQVLDGGRAILYVYRIERNHLEEALKQGARLCPLE